MNRITLINYSLLTLPAAALAMLTVRILGYWHIPWLVIMAPIIGPVAILFLLFCVMVVVWCMSYGSDTGEIKIEKATPLREWYERHVRRRCHNHPDVVLWFGHPCPACMIREHETIYPKLGRSVTEEPASAKYFQAHSEPRAYGITTVQKVWGTTAKIFLDEHKVFEIHELHLEEGGYSSRHRHGKLNAFVLLSGQVAVEFFSGDGQKHRIGSAVLHPERPVLTVLPGQYHRFIVAEPSRMLEIYWNHDLSPVDPNDIERLDEGGKVGIETKR